MRYRSIRYFWEYSPSMSKSRHRWNRFVKAGVKVIAEVCNEIELMAEIDKCMTRLRLKRESNKNDENPSEDTLLDDLKTFEDTWLRIMFFESWFFPRINFSRSYLAVCKKNGLTQNQMSSCTCWPPIFSEDHSFSKWTWVKWCWQAR